MLCSRATAVGEPEHTRSTDSRQLGSDEEQAIRHVSTTDPVQSSGQSQPSVGYKRPVFTVTR